MNRSLVRFILAGTLAISLAACGTSAVPGGLQAEEDVGLEGLSLNAAVVKLAPKAKVASDALQADIESFSGDEIIVKPDQTLRVQGELGTLAVPQSLAVGDILISEPTPEAPSGMFVRVTGVQQSGGLVDYDVTQASFEEAFETLDFDMTRDLSGADLVSAVGPQGLGGSATLNTQGTLFDIDQTFANYVICDDDGNTATTNDQIKINGTFKADVSTFSKIKVGLFKLKLFEAGASLNEQLNLDVKGKCSKSYTKEWLIKEYKFKTFTVWVGPVPIVMTPNVKLYVGSNGQVVAEVDITATQSLTGRYGVRYDSAGWNGIKESTQTRAVTVNKLQGSAQARAFLGPKAGITFYGTATGWGYPKGFVDAKATVSAPPSPLVDFCIHAGLNFSAGADVKLNLMVIKFSKSWSKDFGDVLKYQLLCKQIPYTGTPTTPVSTGKLGFSISPSNVIADLTVRGNGKTYYATKSTVLTLAPGSYTVSGFGYYGAKSYVAPSRTVSIAAGENKTFTVYMQEEPGCSDPRVIDCQLP